MLSSAVGKIDTVSKEIKNNIKLNENDLQVNDNLQESHVMLSNMINKGIERIKKLSQKFRNEPKLSNKGTVASKESTLAETVPAVQVTRKFNIQPLAASRKQTRNDKEAMDAAEKKMEALVKKLAMKREK